MSICRFSSDDFRCDVYVYESHAGFVTHVGARRFAGELPPLPPLDDPAYLDVHRERHRLLGQVEWEPIGGPCDGETFLDDAEDEVADRLRGLRDAGYRVPDWVFELLEESGGT